VSGSDQPSAVSDQLKDSPAEPPTAPLEVHDYRVTVKRTRRKAWNVKAARIEDAISKALWADWQEAFSEPPCTHVEVEAERTR
jgi:hypothetical protein